MPLDRLTQITNAGITSGITITGVNLTGVITTTSLSITGAGISVAGVSTFTRLNVGTGGTVITTTAGGLVGIGTANPSNKFHLYHTSATDAALFETNQGFTTLSFKSLTNTLLPTFGINGAGDMEIDQKDTTKNIKFSFGSQGTKVTIDSSGRLLVGTATNAGASLLQVVKSSGDAFLVRNGDTNYEAFLVQNSSGFTDICATSGGTTARPGMRFFTNDMERMRLDSAGNVGIGTTSGTAKFVVDAGNINNIALRDDSIENHKYNGTAGITVNYNGYNAGTTQFRNFYIYNGKQVQIAQFTGSTGDLSIANGNLVFSTSGKGIDFSATSDASGKTNELLADYEEGTWTPALSGSGVGSYTAGLSNVGGYRKIGKLVTVTCTLHWTAQVTAYTGNLIVSGLPYAAASVSNLRNVGSMGAVSSGLSFTAGYGSWVIVVDPSNTYFFIIQGGTAGNTYSHTPTVSSSGIVYGITVTYMTD